jgi:dolichyl-phosphooligosaccharide-protein glycotransferase
VTEKPTKSTESTESNVTEKLEAEEISIDFTNLAKNTSLWFKNNYVIFLVLIPILISIFVRIQPAYLPMMDQSAENNIYASIQTSITDTINTQYPNLPDANKQALIQEQIDEIYAQGWINSGGQQFSIDELVAQNAEQLKANFQDEYGLTYLGEIDPWYFYRLTENYLDHGYEFDVEIDGRYYDDHQLGGTPRESLGGTTDTMPHFHVTVEAYLYKFVSLFMPNIRLMTVVYFLPVLLATLSVIPAFFLVRRVGGNVGALVSSITVAVHPAFVGRTVAGFSDTDGYIVLFPLFIMWVFVEAIESETKKQAITLAAIAGLLVGVFSIAWGGWWYIYDFLLGVCFISLWYLYVKEWTASQGRKTILKRLCIAIPLAPLVVAWGIIKTVAKTISDPEKRKQRSEQYITTITILTFIVTCGLFVSLISSPTTFINAVKEPFTFTTIKDVAIGKIWPNVLTTVAEFNPASLNDIISSASFGLNIFTLLALLGIGYVLFERKALEKQQQLIVAISIVWIIGLTFITGRIENSVIYLLILTFPLAYCIYKKVPLTTAYFVGISIWYAGIIRYIPWFSSKLFLFFFMIAFPLIVGIIYALVDEKEIDLKYGILLCIWFVGTIYASTKGVRFVMILAPAFSVAIGLGVAFIYKLWTEVISENLKLKKIYAQIALIIAVGILLIIPVSVGYNTGYNQLPLINDQWYNALERIDNEAAPDAIVSSWWDFGHWFKAIADRPVTFDGGTQDIPQAHWIGRALLTDDEKEAVGILRMLDCGGNTAYELMYEATEETYASVMLTKKIIMQTASEAQITLEDAGISEESATEIITYTHCDPPEGYLITSQDMVGKAPVWAHFGSWDFEKAHTVNLVNAYEKEEALVHMQTDLGITEPEALILYDAATTYDPNSWISPWPSYVSMPSGCWQDGEKLLCNAGLIIDLATGEALVQGAESFQHPKALLYLNPDSTFETDYYTDEDDILMGNDRAYSAALVPAGDGFAGFFMDELLLESMFTKLFFYKGHMLECFDLFEYQSTVTGEDIFVWKIDWGCTDPNYVYANAEIYEI